MQTPKAIFFDLDETLAENVIPINKLFSQMYYEFSEQLGSDNKEIFFSKLRTNAATLWATMFDSEATPESQFLLCFADSIKATESVAESQIMPLANNMVQHFRNLSVTNVRLHDGASETLATLREQGFITGIITNGMEGSQLGKIDTLNLESQVDHVIVSAQARAHKPHARVFEFALNKAGVSADQAWQIGDHATNDVAGAIRAGMSGVFYDPGKDRAADAFDGLDENPSHVIHHLSEVVELASSS